MQGTTVWRARLTVKDPRNETHLLSGGKLVGLYYAIGNQGQLVWTVSASQAQLEEAGLSVRHGPSRSQDSKENQSPAQQAQHDGASQQEQAKDIEDGESAKKVITCWVPFKLQSCKTSTLSSMN